MRFLLHALVVAVPLVVGAAHAQESARMPPRSDGDTSPLSVPIPKPYFVSPENMLMRCKLPEFLKCMKWTESECVTVINSSVVEGNAKVEAEAAAKTEAQTSSDFFKGYATGVVIGRIQEASKGKLLGCLSPRKP